MDNPFIRSYQIQYEEGDISLEAYEPIFDPNKKERVHTMLPGETLQSVAYKYYGDSGSWYKIAVYNDLLDPFDEIEEGQQILIP